MRFNFLKNHEKIKYGLDAFFVPSFSSLFLESRINKEELGVES